MVSLKKIAIVFVALIALMVYYNYSVSFVDYNNTSKSYENEANDHESTEIAESNESKDEHLYNFAMEYKNEEIEQFKNYNHYEIKGRASNPPSILLYNNRTYSPWYTVYKYYNDTDVHITFNYTVCTVFLFNSSALSSNNSIDSKTAHSFLQWINNFWYFNVPQIIFLGCDAKQNANDCQSMKQLTENIKRIRLTQNQLKYPTIIIQQTSLTEIPINNLFAYNGANSEAIRRSFSNKVWNMKLFYLRRVAINNPFASKYFFYIDAGIFRAKERQSIMFVPNMTIKCDNFNNNIWPYDKRLKLLDNDKALFMDWTYLNEYVRLAKNNLFENGTYNATLQMVQQRPADTGHTHERNHCQRYFNAHRRDAGIGRISIAGGYIAGTKNAILKFSSAFHFTLYQRYWRAAPWHKLQRDDQFYLAYTICDNPELVTLLHAIQSASIARPGRTAAFIKFFLNPNNDTYYPFPNKKWIIY